MAGVKVGFPDYGKSAEVASGRTVFQALVKAGIEIPSDCGGRGKCGKCRVRAQGGIDPPGEEEKTLLSQEDINSGVRIACLCRLRGDAKVFPAAESVSSDITPYPFVFRPAPGFAADSALKALPLELAPPGGGDRRPDLRRVLDALPSGARPVLSTAQVSALPETLRESGFSVTAYVDGERLVDVAAGQGNERGAGPFGAAVDVGTTSLCVSVVDLAAGEVAASAMAMNPQRLYGADIASRINHARTECGGLGRLRRLVVDKVQSLIEHAAAQAGIAAGDIRKLSLVGNPTMTHIFLGVDPQWLAPAPYVPPTTSLLDFRAAEAGLRVSPGARIGILPAAAAYVGADALAAGIRMRLHEPGDIRLLIDLGTNAEILLAAGGPVYACSAAAGPALEGAHIKCGTTARPGAISEVSIDSAVRIKTINDELPSGICGTGLLDAIAALLDRGIINEAGRLGASMPDDLPRGLAERLVRRDRDVEFVLHDARAGGRPVVINQKDIREVQLAKGAIKAGVEFLLRAAGLSSDDIDSVYLAGALGTHLRAESVLRAGLLPHVEPSKISFIGNAALDGAVEALLSGEIIASTPGFADRINYIELSALESFTDRFVECMGF